MASGTAIPTSAGGEEVNAIFQNDISRSLPAIRFLLRMTDARWAFLLEAACGAFFPFNGHSVSTAAAVL